MEYAVWVCIISRCFLIRKLVIKENKMKYKIEIKGMHCTGCAGLIKMALEDEGISNPVVDVKTNLATFESSFNEASKVKAVLDKVFADLPGYSFTNIKII